MIERPAALGTTRAYDWVGEVWRLAMVEAWLRSLADPAAPDRLLDGLDGR
jgi:hypothetical protein